MTGTRKAKHIVWPERIHKDVHNGSELSEALFGLKISLGFELGRESRAGFELGILKDCDLHDWTSDFAVNYTSYMSWPGREQISYCVEDWH